MTSERAKIRFKKDASREHTVRLILERLELSSIYFDKNTDEFGPSGIRLN